MTKERIRLKVARYLVIAGGALCFDLSASGTMASLLLDHRKPSELALALTLISPLPLFLLSLWSLRISVCALLICNVSLYLIRAFSIGPKPPHNPFDYLGSLFICAFMCLTLAYFLVSKDRRRLAKLFSERLLPDGRTAPNVKL